MKNFTSKMDKRTGLMTTSFVVFAVAVPFVMYKLGAPRVSLFMVSLIMALAFITSYMMIPQLFLNDKTIVIKNNFVNIKIPFDDINTIEENPKIGLNIRTMGVGGLFGHFGYFNGNDVWYVTNIYNKVKITMKSGKVYMISPENPEEFIKKVKNFS
ncbi:PH domain-containing protein [Cloacibacterium sp.]|uniref:PH domain-containing protein n=1 Tax=Cloacibacterium sp. TaxID=1913682 RepID=UPI0039E64FD4